MPRTDDGGFMLDDSELDPYKTEETLSENRILKKQHDSENCKDK